MIQTFLTGIKLYALKRKELGSSSNVVEPRLVLTTTRKLSLEELDPSRSNYHGSND